MTLELLLQAALYLLAGLFVLVFLGQQLFRRRPGRAPRDPCAFRTASSLGNALHQLQSIVDPQVRHAIREQLVEDTENEDENGLADPARHLLRQAARIRRGEFVDRLTAIPPRQKEPPA